MQKTFNLIIAEGAALSADSFDTDYEQLSISGFFDEEVTTDGNEAND